MENTQEILALSKDVGQIKANISGLSNSLNEYIQGDVLRKRDVDERLRLIERRLTHWSAIIALFKFVGGAGLLVMTFKFGDIRPLFQKIFGI